MVHSILHHLLHLVEAVYGCQWNWASSRPGLITIYYYYYY